MTPNAAPSAPNTIPVAERSAGNNYVLVGCKLPGGLVLNLDRMEVLDERAGITRRVEHGKPVRLRGYRKPKGVVNPSEETGGYAMTRVDAEFMAEWDKRNGLKSGNPSSLVVDNLIIYNLADTKSEGVKAGKMADAARERVKEPQQFAPLDPQGDERTRGIGVKKYDAKDDGEATKE